MVALLKASRFGCYTMKGAGFHFIVNSGYDLSTCTAEQLYECPGVSLKTAKFFVMHTRRDQQIACLDTHVLKWFRALGYEDVPASSPQSHKTYQKWEDLFLAECKKRNKTPADLDLEVWNHYAGNIDSETITPTQGSVSCGISA
jgi:thermostable 8-oxoguanine DNA glycosylase